MNLMTPRARADGLTPDGPAAPPPLMCGVQSETIDRRLTASVPPEGAEGVKPSALVVDDVPDVTQMLTLLLRHAGYDVTSAYAAVEALEAARGRRFDIVVSDIGMPGMNGYELAEELRALPDYRAVPLIAVTGFALYNDRERALQAGFSAFLTKPIDPRALLELIARLRR